jgi:AcrR family transcriptional regulator
MPAALLAPRLMRSNISFVGTNDPTEIALCDQGGRPLGPRAQNTRVRILDATVVLLDQKPMRDLRVIDIARRIGSSPATFYQYFKDVEDVVLHLASRVSESTPELVELIRGDWSGRAGHERGRKLAEVVISHWDRYAPILRVRNNACDEGDIAFRELRFGTLMPIVHAFAEVIAASQAAARERAAGSEASEEWQGGHLDPMMGAVALASVLERLSMYHGSIEELGGTREDLIETLATLLQSMLTVKR